MKSLTKLAIFAGTAGAAAYAAAKKFMPENSKEILKEKAHEIGEKVSAGQLPDKDEALEMLSKVGDTALYVGKEIGSGAKDFVEKNINPDGPLAASFNGLKETLATKLEEMKSVENFPVDWIKLLESYENAAETGNIENLPRIGSLDLTHDELLSQFTLWAFLGAPLNAAADIDKLGSEERVTDLLNIVSNEEIIAIEKDNLNNPYKRIKTDSIEDIIIKPLENNEFALCFFNKNSEMKICELNIPNTLNEFGISSECYEVNDLYTKESFPIKDNLLKCVLPHGTRAFKIKAK